MDPLYQVMETVLPFSWVQYDFMKNAFLAIVFITPLFALMGTLVVNNRMAFFSDVLGHSALTGIAIGTLLGLSDPLWPMVVFMASLAVLISLFKKFTDASFDTVLGVFFAFVVSLGIVILSRNGGFSKITGFLIGDILTVTPQQLLGIGLIFFLFLVYWIFLGNSLTLLSVNPVLLGRRRLSAFVLQTSFAVLLAIVVAICIRLVGILIINSLLILPAASSRNIARNMKEYTAWAIVFSFISGMLGLVFSYYWATACGATIVLFASMFYGLSVVRASWYKRRK